MVKVKRKVEMNLPQLIEWAKNNEIKNRMVLTKDSYCVGFDRHGYIYFNSTLTMPLNQVFTVEIEEEITLTTPLPVMLHVWKTGIFGTEIKEVKNKSIASQYTICSTEFWLKQGDEMTLIWKNGKLVE